MSSASLHVDESLSCHCGFFDLGNQRKDKKLIAFDIDLDRISLAILYTGCFFIDVRLL